MRENGDEARGVRIISFLINSAFFAHLDATSAPTSFFGHVAFEIDNLTKSIKIELTK